MLISGYEGINGVMKFKQNDIALAKEHHQIWDNIIELMDQLVQTCGKDYINLENYLKLINDGLDSIQIALIPPGYDYVTLAPFEHNTLNNKKTPKNHNTSGYRRFSSFYSNN